MDNVDQTIQWARELLRRRRNEIFETKKKADVSSSSDIVCPNKTSTVKELLERGRSLLAEAEAHSEKLGQYTDKVRTLGVLTTNGSRYCSDLSNTNVGKEESDFMFRFLRESSSEDNKIKSNMDESFESFSTIALNQSSTGNYDMENIQPNRNSHVKVYDRVALQENDANSQLDQLIATIRRQREDPMKEIERCLTPVKQVSTFDPSTMKAAQRATLRKVKRDEERAAVAESQRIKPFKALPLPGGVEVKHNIFAPTQSYTGKYAGMAKFCRRSEQARVLDTTSSMSLGGFEEFDSISMVTSRTSGNNSFSTSYENERDREHALQMRAEKLMKKRELLDSINKIVAKEGISQNDDASNANNTNSQIDYIEDQSKLRQQIARLEARLKHKKNQRLATLNDIVDIDLNSSFERLISGNVSENTKVIIDQLKKRVCGKIAHGMLLDHSQPQKYESNRNSLCDSDDEERKTSVRNLYRRHEIWLREREQKISNAKSQLDEVMMSDVTGKPAVTYTKHSWEKAKNAHDEIMKKVNDNENRKQREKTEKSRIEMELKAKEIVELQEQANVKMKPVQNERNNKEHMKRLEKLSQPRQVKEDQPPFRKNTEWKLMDGSEKHFEKQLPELKTTNISEFIAKKSNRKTSVSVPAVKYIERSGLHNSRADRRDMTNLVKKIRKLTKLAESTNENIILKKEDMNTLNEIASHMFNEEAPTQSFKPKVLLEHQIDCKQSYLIKSTKPKMLQSVTMRDNINYSGKRYSDMNDQEFSKLVKQISKVASKKVKVTTAGIPNEGETIHEQSNNLLQNAEIGTNASATS